jgi:hypothetical protein
MPANESKCYSFCERKSATPDALSGKGNAAMLRCADNGEGMTRIVAPGKVITSIRRFVAGYRRLCKFKFRGEKHYAPAAMPDIPLQASDGAIVSGIFLPCVHVLSPRHKYYPTYFTKTLSWCTVKALLPVTCLMRQKSF